jgi:hypothetical protein
MVLRGWRAWWVAVPVLAVVLAVRPGEAQPPGPDTFCDAYPDAPACDAGEVTCGTCHETPPALNRYGVDVSAALAVGTPRPLAVEVFETELVPALHAVEGLDSDGDGFSNLAEIESGSAPSSASSKPRADKCEDEDDDGWIRCGYDVNYAYRKVMLDFCGRSAVYVERQAFEAEENPKKALHRTLDQCLQSEHWRGIGGAVWNLANRKIGPLKAVKAGKGGGPIPLADYDDDYAYFVWTQTEDRDARQVLTGQRFVTARYEDGVTVYDPWDRDPDEDYALRGFSVSQGVVKERRAGLMTHRWFLMSNTMFTPLPRTTAAQAYRAFLGYDIARLEGLFPIEGEPVDYDRKGVAQPTCAVCHSTLDPLAYAFSRYEGIEGYYAYNPSRMYNFVGTEGDSILDVPEAGALFGEPVSDLVEWARVAANSDAFARATVLDYWRLLIGGPPAPLEQLEFATLVDDFTETHGYQIEAMLHDLVDTEAYGAP